MISDETQNERAHKLQAVDLALRFLNDADQGAIRMGLGRNRPRVDLDAHMPQWKATTVEQFEGVGIPAGWSRIIGQVPHSGIGVSLAQEFLGILKMRVQDRRDDSLDDSDAALVAIVGWLDTVGSGLISQASIGRMLELSHEEDQQFPGQLRQRLREARDWFGAHQSLLATIVTGELRLIEDRYDGEAPYELSQANSWHMGWSMVAVSWILANSIGDTLPTSSFRLCRFDEAQQARRTYRDIRLVTCPRCSTEIEPLEQVMTMSASELFPVAARCAACELQIQFPEQAVNESIWTGPLIEVKKKERDSSAGKSPATSDGPANACHDEKRIGDPKKVFIIHGRNIKAANEMATFVRALGLTPIAFNELRARMGGTPNIADIVTRGMDEAQGVIALFTGDEWSELRPEFKCDHDKPHDVARWQSRPNVIFEAGMAFGRDRKRVVFVVLGDAELFTDVAGIHVLRPSNNPASDRDTLRLTLKNMGCSVEDSSAWMTAGDFEGVVMRALSTSSPFGGTDNLPTTLVTASDPKILADRHTIKSLADVVNSRWLENFKYGQLMDPKYIRQEELDVLDRYAVLATMPENAFYDEGLRSSHAVFIEAIESYRVISAQERVPAERDPGSFVLSVKSAGARAHIVDYDVKLGNQLQLIVSAVNQLWTAWGEYARAAKLFEVGRG